MLKDIDDKPIEPARRKAERRWRNYHVEKQFKENQKAEAQLKQVDDTSIAIAETISNEKPDHRRSAIKLQTKFAHDIREMMEGHAKRNLYYHLIALKARKENEYKRYLMMKLRLLEIRVAEREDRINKMWSE
jgi:hypothetical protein